MIVHGLASSVNTGGLRGSEGHVRQGNTGAVQVEDVMRGRLVQQLYDLAKSNAHFVVLLVSCLKGAVFPGENGETTFGKGHFRKH